MTAIASSPSARSGEPGEQAVLQRLGNAGPAVRDQDLHAGLGTAQLHRDQATVRRMADRVVERVGQRSLDHAEIGLHGRQRVGDIGHQALPAGLGGSCLTITYNPMVVPKGVEPSSDPMIAARAAPDAVGLSRRVTEGAKQQ